MLEFIYNQWNGNEDLVTTVSNSVFYAVFFLTFLFIFILLQQKDLNKLLYKREQINKNPVNVLYSSNWIDDELPVLLIIPGNPGQAGYYQEYMDFLILHSDEKFRACVVSHVGHSPGLDRVFNVKDQVCEHISFHSTFLFTVHSNCLWWSVSDNDD